MLLLLIAAMAMIILPAITMAQENPAAKATGSLKETNPEVAKWILIMAGLAMSFASSVGAIAQTIAVKSACEGISRNPGATKDIRGALIIGLVLIESLILYTLVVVFVKM